MTACVVDHGRFVSVARTLGERLGKVYYTTHQQERDCPMLKDSCVGDGFPEIERVTSLWEVKSDCDLFVFTDIGFVWEQEELRRQGFPLWGPGAASWLESKKGIFLSQLAETKLPVPPHTVIVGIDNLRAALKDEEDKYIKISTFRGDWETLHWTSYGDMESVLDNYAVRFGALKNELSFYVFDPIETKIEDGIDAYRVGGKWPRTVMHGMEHKDKSYIGTMDDMENIAPEVRIVNEEFGPILDKFNPGGAMKFSTEVRITDDGESFFIDPTCRFGSPPHQGELSLIKNMPEIIARGAFGVLVEPECDDKFVVQAAVSSDVDRSEWNSFKLDSDVAAALKCGFCCMVDDRLVFPPITDYHSSELGYLCATGDTIKSAIESLRKLKDNLPSGMKCDIQSLSHVLSEIHEAEKQGMEFTPQSVPEPATVIDS